MELQIFGNRKEKGYMLQINEDEAMQIISSLSSQILAGNPNSGRKEFYTNKGEYFSVSVVCEKELYYKKCIKQRDDIIEETNEQFEKLLTGK